MVFCLHGEFDVGVLIIEVLKEVVQLLLAVLPNDEGVVNVSEPEVGLSHSVACCSADVLNSSMNMLAMMGDSGDPMAAP